MLASDTGKGGYREPISKILAEVTGQVLETQIRLSRSEQSSCPLLLGNSPCKHLLLINLVVTYTPVEGMLGGHLHYFPNLKA